MSLDNIFTNDDSHNLNFSRILGSIVILGKACDLIDYHQQNKKLMETSPKKKEQNKSATNNGTRINGVESLKKEGLNDVTNSKPTLKVATKDINLQGAINEDKEIDNTLNVTEVPLSPLSPSTIQARNKELRMSAIELDSKIQNLFAKRGNLLNESSSVAPNENKKMDDPDKTNVEDESLQRGNIGLIQYKTKRSAKNIQSHKSNLLKMSDSVASHFNTFCDFPLSIL